MSDFCWWTDCSNEPSHRVTDVRVVPRGSTKELSVGDIYLCPRHFDFTKRTGRVNLDPEVLFAAIDREQEQNPV